MSAWFDYGRDQLADQLASLYPTEADIRTVLATAGIPATMIAFDGKTFNIWVSTIGVANNLEQLDALVDTVAAQYPNKEAGLRKLLRMREPSRRPSFSVSI